MERNTTWRAPCETTDPSATTDLAAHSPSVGPAVTPFDTSRHVNSVHTRASAAQQQQHSCRRVCVVIMLQCRAEREIVASTIITTLRCYTLIARTVHDRIRARRRFLSPRRKFARKIIQGVTDIAILISPECSMSNMHRRFALVENVEVGVIIHRDFSIFNIVYLCNRDPK